ncbi:MAG TPA: c-type cytochrome [Solirubrobacterales bacterium]|nr:c-type cytochrome [Solirubrobacterales bacterium]
MHETLFYICGGVLVVSALVVSFVGLKRDDFPGKLMPLIIVWFAAFAVATGTFAVLHGKDESKEHDAEYSKASEEIQKDDTSGPFEEAEKEAAEAAGGGGESTEAEGTEGESAEGETASGGGNPEMGAVVFSENCATCHGATGHGGAGGPDLRTMPLAQSEEGAIQQVTHGGGGMPPFEGVLSEEEIENVASYVAQDITEGE